jgi:hypothetical protein
MNPPLNSQSEILLELITLRSGANPQAYFDKLYLALTVHYSDTLIKLNQTDLKKAIDVMINFFAESQAYEKCETLRLIQKRMERLNP